MNDLKMKQMNKDTIDSQHSPIQTIMQSSQEEAPNPSEKRYARLSERIGYNEFAAIQKMNVRPASNMSWFYQIKQFD